MNDTVSQRYEDSKNVEEMKDWNPALSLQKMSGGNEYVSC